VQNAAFPTEFLNAQMPAALEMLHPKVGINSFTSNREGVNKLGRFTAECFAPLGFTNYKQDLTFNVGTVSGGTVLNRVPHEAFVEGEFRAFSPHVYADAKVALLALAGPGEVRSPVDRYSCDVKVEILTESRPWPRNPATDQFATIWQQAGTELGIPVNVEERGGLSDGNLI
jgi:glutamate carboxypeptidase